MSILLNLKTDLFFDKPLVLSKLSKTERKVLSKQGAVVRTTARGSIRRRKKSAKPGQPPSAHGDLIKKILFQYEPSTNSVIVGFMKLNAKTGTGTAMTVPELLEGGGTAKSPRTGESVIYPAFPTMGPALQVEQPKFAEMWRDTL